MHKGLCLYSYADQFALMTDIKTEFVAREMNMKQLPGCKGLKVNTGKIKREIFAKKQLLS